MKRQAQTIAVGNEDGSKALRADKTRTGDLSFLRQLVQARHKAGLTQEEVARRMGTTSTVIARLENGGGKKQHSPTVATLRKYAHAVGCHLEISLSPVVGRL